MRSMRLFVDTSVFGGMFDEEFEEDTRVFFGQVAAGRFTLAVSEQIYDEILPAPTRVRKLFDVMLPYMTLFVDSPEVQRLANIYLERAVVGPKWLNDALHVAYATFHGCAGLVSWNFKHMVRPDKYDLFNLVNASLGYPPLFIASPKEVLSHA